MSSTTPNLTLTLYDSSTDQAVGFATFRAVWGGPATTSNFYRIDTAHGLLAARVTALEVYKGAIPVASAYISANYYEATVAAITAYTTGMTIILSVDTTTSGTVTLNINALGTKSLMKVDSTGAAINLTGSDLVDGRQYLFVYDGTRWLWVSANSADQIQIVGTAGNVVTVGTTNNLLGTTTQAGLIADTTHAATAKTTLTGNDEFSMVDSAAANVLKRITWTSFQTAIGTALGVIINAITGKTTPVGADVIAIGDSASSFVSKMVLLSNLYKAIGTGTQNATTFLNGTGAYSSPLQNVVQAVHTQTGEVATGTTVIPADNTIPQITEGDQYMTLAITPTSATNKLVIEFVGNFSVDLVKFLIVALFQDSTANALAACMSTIAGNTYANQATLQYEMVAGTTSATTFRIRAGAYGAGGTVTFNGVSGSRYFGGVMCSSLRITEYKV